MEKGTAMDRHKGDKHGYTETWTDTKVANMDTQTWTHTRTDTKVTHTWIHRDMDRHKGDKDMDTQRHGHGHKGDTDMDTQ